MESENQNPEISVKNVSFLTSGQMDANVEKMAKDMKFFSIFYIVYGVLACLTIIGAIIGIPMIIYHLKLNDSAKSYRSFVHSNDFFHLHKAFENQRKFFFFYKVLLIIVLVFFVLYFIVLIYIISTGLMNFPQDFALV